MKHSFKILIKGLFIIVLFTGSTIVLSAAGVKTVNEANAAVSNQQVNQYLMERGYQVISLAPVTGYKTEDWTAQTVLNGVRYNTIVHVSGTQIVDIGNTPL